MMWCLLMLAIAVCFLKNEITYRNTVKANERIFSQPCYLELLNKHRPNDNYFSNFINPFKWTYKQMFPGI